MKQYEVVFNEKLYKITVEELQQAEETKKNEQSIETIKSPATPERTSGEVVSAPMAGTIVHIEQKAGQQVKAGDAVMVLEALKMENNIVATKDGILSAFFVTEGQSVNTNESLFEIR